MIFCARATRGRRLPSHGLLARPGISIAKQSEGRVGEKCLPVGGRVRKLRAGEDQSDPIPEEGTSKLGGSMNIVRCAQERAATAIPLYGRHKESEGPRQGKRHVPEKSIAKQPENKAGKNIYPWMSRCGSCACEGKTTVRSCRANKN